MKGADFVRRLGRGKMKTFSIGDPIVIQVKSSHFASSNEVCTLHAVKSFLEIRFPKFLVLVKALDLLLKTRIRTPSG